jgi:rRNA biogenesis protein RRP5
VEVWLEMGAAVTDDQANKGKKRRRQISEREAKRLKKNQVDESRKERDKDTIRVEELNYKVR